MLGSKVISIIIELWSIYAANSNPTLLHSTIVCMEYYAEFINLFNGIVWRRAIFWFQMFQLELISMKNVWLLLF